jgi:hypothetical protein
MNCGDWFGLGSSLKPITTKNEQPAIGCSQFMEKRDFGFDRSGLIPKQVRLL